MESLRSRAQTPKRPPSIRRELRVFAWNLRSFSTPFEQQSLALNTIERGRAWHWRLLPAGWADAAFILRHGQLKTKRAFATFFPGLKRDIQEPKRPIRTRKPKAAEKPIAWKKLKVVEFADLIDAKISALSTRGFARDFVDLYAAHSQKSLDWRRLPIRSSANQLNDYNPVEFENNLRLLEREFQKGAQDIPCAYPPQIRDLTAFLQELRIVNAEVARELARLDEELEK